MDLYNKYRPKDFSDLFPTSPIIQALPTLVNRVLNGDDDAIPKAMLFYSEEYGTGKTTTARILAIALNQNLSEAEKEMIMSGQDVPVCKTINAARFRGIGDMSVIDEEIRYKRDSLIPARYFYIIDEAHKITADAQDLLLKTIEDLGSSPVYIILTSSQYDKNSNALLTRVQKYFFRALTDSEVKRLVKETAEKEGFAIEDKYVDAIAVASGGSARDALSRLSQFMLTRSIGPGVEDEGSDAIDPAMNVAMSFINMADSQSTWRDIMTPLRKGLSSMRADEFRVELLKATTRVLDRPPRVKNIQRFRKIVATLAQNLLSPVEYPEKTNLILRLYIAYNDIVSNV